ncbi:ATP-dependent RecD-like DNA helicase [Gimesia maris]|uniref:ATP-dependent RecD-like DNA helicase n=2 Tax=Gimesia maris TaxID=122 RepID=A0ABX5YP18_9PLAN|nr:ATP-dependent RecD-like DNA helicase [Gimesia maris]
MESPYASWMQRMRLEQPERVTPDEMSEEGRLITDAGNQYEAKFLAGLKADGRDVCEIPRVDRGDCQATLQAMQQQREIIYQGTLESAPFRGMTDFLVRSADAGSLYEVWDTKLARKVKPYFLIQLCCYSEMLEALQGTRPEWMQVVLGNGEQKRFRTDDYYYYYLRLKQAFLRQMDEFDAETAPPYPDPRADHFDWQSHAEQILLEHDHLFQVAGISKGQIKKLNAAGIQTVAELAQATDQHVPKLSEEIRLRLVEQAALQVMTRQNEESAPEGAVIQPTYRILRPDPLNPGSGLTMLPPPSTGDVYFDIEGYSLVDGGLEYLLGAVTLADGQPVFHDWWAHNEREERRSFEAFIDWVYQRWQADPAMHVYHYAPYEQSALKRLMSRYATREEEVDQLLRQGVLVDLYQVVRKGLLLGARNYSLKTVEKLYKEKRAGDVQDAVGSIVFYANWLERGESPDWRQSPLLKQIRDYNEEDCVSTYELAAWLWDRQREQGVDYVPGTNGSRPANDPAQAEPPPQNQDVLERQQLARQLKDEIPETDKERAEQQDHWQVQEMLAYLLEFHRREAKPVWWAMFDRADKSELELIEELDCLGGLTLTGEPPVTIKRSRGYRYEFDPQQDTKLAAGKKAFFSHDLSTRVEIHEFDSEGSVVLKISAAKVNQLPDAAMPERLSLIPDEFVSPGAIESAIGRLAERWSESRDIPGAFHKFLLRQPPQLGNYPGYRKLSVLNSEADLLENCLEVVREMEDSTLCIQGPPGAGKTYTASHIITDLLQNGKNVGITSNSHQAILNVMSACGERMGDVFEGIKVGGSDEEPLFEKYAGLQHIQSGAAAADVYQGGLIGGTAWLFSQPEMESRLDYLFIDEAGQVSIANLAGMCQSARNLVLIGDQMQLGQPTQGVHPGESGQSLLEYLLRDHAVVPDQLGIFLDQTWRMHPGVCEFISQMVYEGNLKSHPGTAHRIIKSPGWAGHLGDRQAGVLFSPVEHTGNTQASDEEVERIVELTRELLACQHTGEDQSLLGTLQIEDILYVAPYNMQVRKLRDRLPEGARVGSVDKFQGQEAPVVIVSMCCSAGEYGSRGLEFVLNKNRLNVAVSRAKSLAIIVGDPAIAHTSVNSTREIECVNLFCRLLDEAR